MSSLQKGSGAGGAAEGGLPGRVAELPVAVGPHARGTRLLHSIHIRRPGMIDMAIVEQMFKLASIRKQKKNILNL